MHANRTLLAAAALVALCVPIAACEAGSGSPGPSGLGEPHVWPKEEVEADTYELPTQYPKDVEGDCVATGNGVQVAGLKLATNLPHHGRNVWKVAAAELSGHGFHPDRGGDATYVKTAIIIVDDFDEPASGSRPDLDGLDDNRWKDARWLVDSELYTGKYDDQDLLMIAVAIDHYDPSWIKKHLETLEADLDGLNVVLNLSFEYLPCQYLDGADFPEPDPALLQVARYQQLMAGVTNAARLAELADYLQSHTSEAQATMTDVGIETDLFSFLKNHTDWVSVAAAGNGIGDYDRDNPPPPSDTSKFVRLPFPTAPAIWDRVLSASADVPPIEGRAAYSNAGEIMLPGDLEPGVGDTPQGTSFAAPRLSVLEALRVSGWLNDCSSYPPSHPRWNNTPSGC